MAFCPSMERFMECTRKHSTETDGMNCKEINHISIIMGNYWDIVTIGGGKCHGVTGAQGSEW